MIIKLLPLIFIFLSVVYYGAAQNKAPKKIEAQAELFYRKGIQFYNENKVDSALLCLSQAEKLYQHYIFSLYPWGSICINRRVNQVAFLRNFAVKSIET